MNLDKYLNKPVALVLATGQKVICEPVKSADNSGYEFLYVAEYGINQQGQEVVVPYHPYSKPDQPCDFAPDFIRGAIEITHENTLDQWKKLTQQATVVKPSNKIVLPGGR